MKITKCNKRNVQRLKKTIPYLFYIIYVETINQIFKT